MKFINLCVRTCDMTWTSYIGKLNSILGTVVPLAMFTIYFGIFFVKVETECLFYCIYCLGSVHHTVVKVLLVASLLINTTAAGQSCSIHNGILTIIQEYLTNTQFYFDNHLFCQILIFVFWYCCFLLLLKVGVGVDHHNWGMKMGEGAMGLARLSRTLPAR